MLDKPKRNATVLDPVLQMRDFCNLVLPESVVTTGSHAFVTLCVPPHVQYTKDGHERSYDTMRANLDMWLSQYFPSDQCRVQGVLGDALVADRDQQEIRVHRVKLILRGQAKDQFTAMWQDRIPLIPDFTDLESNPAPLDQHFDPLMDRVQELDIPPEGGSALVELSVPASRAEQYRRQLADRFPGCNIVVPDDETLSMQNGMVQMGARLEGYAAMDFIRQYTEHQKNELKR